ncbi:hypothetical protein IMY05_C4706000600 [Salix suchowensis]|nr:hypothetical protein IMY05_C4706000600 [Salix suchowensis]
MKRPRRPSSEVAAEKTKKIQKKAHDDELRMGKFHKVARIEQAAKLADKENSHLPALPVRSKVRTLPGHQPRDDSKEEHLREREQRNAEKKEAKRLARSLIEVERAAMNHGNVPVKIKRKADSHRFPAKKRKRKNPVGGLRDGWSIKDKVPPEASQAHIDNPDSDCEPIGGISDNDDISSERAALDADASGPRFKSLAKVNLAPVIPTPHLSATRQQTLIRKKKITRNDLPDGIRRDFCDKSIPYAIRLAGYKEAWYNPTHADAYQSWLADLARSEEGYGQPSEKHIAVAEKLINNHIAQIRNKTKEAAVKALDILLRNENKNSIEEKADYVKWLQGDGLYDNKPPFLYKRIENGKRKGAFQSFLIAFTFSLHLAAISGIPQDIDFEKQSIKQPGALVMAVQAVKRALFYYRSGVKEEPNPRDTLSHFSHSNWSDREETIIDDYGEPTTKLIPITSSIKSLVDQLSSEQWRKVIEEATQFTLKETDPLPSAAVSEYNENPKLVDDDEDLQPQPSSIDYDNPKSQSTTSSSGLTYDNSQSQPTAGSSHSANDDFQSQPSPGELGARPGTTYMTLITMT